MSAKAFTRHLNLALRHSEHSGGSGPNLSAFVAGFGGGSGSAQGFLILERKRMKKLTTILKTVTLGSIGGAVLGFIASYAYYVFIAVPQAEHMDIRTRGNFLHLAAQTLEVFVILGSFLGGVFGIGIGSGILLGRRKAAQRDA